MGIITVLCIAAVESATHTQCHERADVPVESTFWSRHTVSCFFYMLGVRSASPLTCVLYILPAFQQRNPVSTTCTCMQEVANHVIVSVRSQQQTVLYK